MMKEEFSWVITHNELTEFLKSKENSQIDLIQILKDIGISPLNDKIENNITVELEEIDPFTFYSYIYKYGHEKRLINLQNIAKKLDLSFPYGQSGIPSAQPQKVWLFPYKLERKNNEVSRLWAFFRKATTNDISDEDFKDVIKIKGTGKTKLTEALFYIDPINYLPINGPTIPYIKEVLGLNPNFSTYHEYVELLNIIRSKSSLPFYELSYEAWKMSNESKQINYWVFQGNSKVFDFETALRTGILDDWTVSSHKEKIKTGDKVIIWISGSKAGCYALAEITSEPQPIETSPDDHLWKISRNRDLKAKIRITHNLIDNPILKEEVSQIKELTELKVGIQGTNFIATKEEYEKILEIVSNKNSQRYWLYAPGENATKWDEFFEQGIMGLGWDLLPDLSKFSDGEQIREELKKLYGGTTNRNNDTLANFEFLSIMKIGDIIIPKQGKENYLGYGVVSSNYYYDEKRKNYKHCRNVNWIKNGNWKEVDKSIVLKTLTDVTKYIDYVEKLKKLIGIESIERNEKNSIMEYSLNTIFYGPPGTGKTYNTVLRAAEIIKGEKIDSYSESLKIFKENLHNQIEFITFHQNYSYEDFIQGLRPDTEIDSQQLRFEKKDGIFKIIADRALKNLTESSKAPEELSKEKRFELALENFIEDLNEKEGIYKITENCQVYEVEADAFRYKGDNWIRHSNGIRMKFSDLKEFYLNDIQNRKDVKLLSNISALAKDHSSYYFGVYQGILKFLKNENTQVEIETVQKNYVIIIDEINRANISRVFGELITLIEPDKRSHGEIPMEVILPSGDSFVVPSNLYIIGTMNTADKSIALLDIALRRRFEFEPMYPIDYQDEIGGQKIYDVDILKKLNEKIKEIKGYDFQIGHAFFMNEKETLVQRMNKKIIPLLLEYFMNDKKEVESILHFAGLLVEENTWPLKITGRK